MVEALLATKSDAAFFVDDRGDSSATLMLVRCGCLRAIAEVGFVDLKEQALPSIASAHSITVIRRALPVAASLRTPADYIHALRAYHLSGPRGGQDVVDRTLTVFDTFAEEWSPAFAITEADAHVEQGARIHDSVIMSGASVGRNAVIVRSVICPGAVVRADAVVLDQVVGAQGKSLRHAQVNRR